MILEVLGWVDGLGELCCLTGEVSATSVMAELSRKSLDVVEEAVVGDDDRTAAAELDGLRRIASFR